MKTTASTTSHNSVRTISDNSLWSNFPKALKAVGLSGMLLGLICIFYSLNTKYLHWPCISYLVLIAIVFFLFYCFRMNFEGKRSIAKSILWIGMTYLYVILLFRILNWPGGTGMGYYGVPNIVVIIAAIVFWHQIPQELSWSRKVIGLWSIGLSLIGIVLWFMTFYSPEIFSVADSFEPAIPYAYNCVNNARVQAITRDIITLGNGIATFLFSLPMYIVARKHSK